MAWVNDRWLDRNEREEMIQTLKLGIEKLKRKLENGSITENEAIQLRVFIDELKRLNRIHRAEFDLLYFSWEYFSETRNPGNQGNWDGFELDRVEDAAEFHKEINAVMDEVSNSRKNAKEAVAAPRGHAKSTYLSKSFPIREICFRKRRYIISISETPSVSMGNLDWIAWQLKTNEKLRRDFGPLLHPKQQMNQKDNSVEFIAWEPAGDGGQKLLTLVQAASTGQALRGRNWNGVRPDLVICDDLEDIRSNAATKELREKMWDWFTQTVMALGDPKGKKTAYIYMGTIVHAESLLNRVLKERTDFRSTRYQALIEEPDRTDLWEKCRAIYLDENKTKEERKRDAEAFYLENKKEMDAGAVVLWPEVQPLWRLMTWKWDNGSKAFNTEYQNNPRDEESQIFNPENFRYYDVSDLVDSFGRPLPLDYYGFWDMAQGKNKRSDYNAIVTIGRDKRNGIIYVIDAWAKKCPAHVALDEVVKKIIEYGHRVFSPETVGAQHDMYRQLQERLAKGRIYGTKLKPVISRTKKEERIEALEPLIEQGYIRFLKGHRLLLEHLEQFPNGSHDDLADALAGAVEVAGGTRTRRTFHKKPVGC